MSDEHQSGEREPERTRVTERQVGLPAAALGAIMTAALAGGGGSWVTGASVASELREFRVEMRADITALRTEVARLQSDHSAAILRLTNEALAREERLRALELWRARMEAREDRATPR